MRHLVQFYTENMRDIGLVHKKLLCRSPGMVLRVWCCMTSCFAYCWPNPIWNWREDSREGLQLNTVTWLNSRIGYVLILTLLSMLRNQVFNGQRFNDQPTKGCCNLGKISQVLLRGRTFRSMVTKPAHYHWLKRDTYQLGHLLLRLTCILGCHEHRGGR